MENKELIIEALLGTKREGIEDLVSYMENIGFFTAPCSGSYHLAKEGGLAEHTVNVLDISLRLAKAFYQKKPNKEFENSIIISAILHDLGKCGQFSKPNYIPNILKSGEQSTSKPYSTNPDLLYIDHEIRSIAIASMFIDLTEEEQFAILYHNALYSNVGRYNLPGKEIPLQMIIHFADLWSCRVVEK